MSNFIKSIFAKKEIHTITYSNRRENLVKIRRAIAEGYAAVWNGLVWVLTKLVVVI